MFDVISSWIAKAGPLGVFLLMFVENLFPPIPSEVIMPLAGYQAAAGAMSFGGVVAAGTLGSVLGALAWYGVGRYVGLDRLATWAERHGRWLTLRPDEVRRADEWFRRYGVVAVCVGRSLPGVRGVICIPAGIAGMPIVPFLVSCSLGSLAWCTLLTVAGYVLRANFRLVEHWLNPVTTAFLLICIATYLYRVATFRLASPI